MTRQSRMCWRLAQARFRFSSPGASGRDTRSTSKALTTAIKRLIPSEPVKSAIWITYRWRNWLWAR